MGLDTASTAYAAELQGMGLVLEIALEHANEYGERRDIAIYRQSSRHLVWSQGGRTIRRMYPCGRRVTSLGAPEQGTDNDCLMATSLRRHTQEQGC